VLGMHRRLPVLGVCPNWPQRTARVAESILGGGFNVDSWEHACSEIVTIPASLLSSRSRLSWTPSPRLRDEIVNEERGERSPEYWPSLPPTT